MRLKALAVLAIAFGGQGFGQQIPSLTPSTTAPAPTAPDAPYGRVNPRGTVVGFLDTAQARNWPRALRYLEVPPRMSASDAEALPKHLKYVLDNQVINLNRISNDPQGSLDDSLPPDQESIAVVKTETGAAPILLHRVKNGDTQIWLFSSATLSQIAKVAKGIGRPAIEEYLPDFLLIQTHVFSLRLWQLLSLLIAIPLAFLIASLLTRLLIALLRPLILAVTKEKAGKGIEAIRNPVRLIVLVLVMHAVAYSILSLPLLARQLLIDLVSIVTVALTAWLLSRLVEIFAQLMLARLRRLRQPGSMAVVNLVRRLLKAGVLGLAALIILRHMGVNLTAVLAGAGVAGIAIALAAQKTLENLFGGIMIITDEPIRVGDTCKFGDQTGTVKDIGLRSTEFRTDRRTIVSVPNGQLAAMSLENLSARDKMLFNPTIGLRCESTADQTRFVLAGIRRLLYEHPKVETATARVRFVKLADSSLNLEVFAYVQTPEYTEFLAVQEDLLLHILDIVEAAGSGLAFPSQTLYLGKDGGLDADKARAAVAKVAEWRQKKSVPFPDFPPEEIAAMDNTLPYPPPDSAQRDAE